MNVKDSNAKKGSNSNDDDDDNLNKELSNMNINISTGSSNRTCLCCLKEVKGSSRCSQCRTALYCSRECQLKHWPVHKNVCQDSNNTQDSDEKLYKKAHNHCNQGIAYIYFNRRSSLLI